MRTDTRDEGTEGMKGQKAVGMTEERRDRGRARGARTRSGVCVDERILWEKRSSGDEARERNRAS
eukprot:3925608-Rhodomonas_salina.2